MTRGIPVLLVIVSRLGTRQQRLLVDTRVSRLVEGRNAKLLVGIFFDDTEGVLVRVEGRHKNKGHVDLVGCVEMFNLTDGQVKESHVIFDFKGTFGASHTCS